MSDSRQTTELAAHYGEAAPLSRMRTILRFAKDPRTEAGLRELISDAEARLAALEANR
jgi:hypothetical protein